MKIAAVTWDLRANSNLEEFFSHFEQLLSLCQGADLVVFPELPCLECVDPGTIPVSDMAAALADLFEPQFHRFGHLAKEAHATVVAGSFFRRTTNGVVNTALVATAEGDVYADVPKVVMTQFEATEWNVLGGQGLRRLPDPQIGVTVCYDVEFPDSGRVLAESGVLVQCVPSFTETEHGFTRVRRSCQARAIENQIIVVHAALVGSLGAEPVPQAVGSSAILVPPVDPFPASGVWAESGSDQECVVMAEIDLDVLLAAREQGDVRNWNDRNRGDWTLRRATSLE